MATELPRYCSLEDVYEWIMTNPKEIPEDYRSQMEDACRKVFKGRWVSDLPKPGPESIAALLSLWEPQSGNSRGDPASLCLLLMNTHGVKMESVKIDLFDGTFYIPQRLAKAVGDTMEKH
jgi:hypothetical protein